MYVKAQLMDAQVCQFAGTRVLPEISFLTHTHRPIGVLCAFFVFLARKWEICKKY